MGLYLFRGSLLGPAASPLPLPPPSARWLLLVRSQCRVGPSVLGMGRGEGTGEEGGRGGWGGSRPGALGWSQEAVRGLRPRSASCLGSTSSPREAEGRGEDARVAAGSVPVWEPRWMRWLTMMLLPKPPMEAMVVLCSRCTTAVMPPSAISRWIRLRASSPLAPDSEPSPGK